MTLPVECPRDIILSTHPKPKSLIFTPNLLPMQPFPSQLIQLHPNSGLGQNNRVSPKINSVRPLYWLLLIKAITLGQQAHGKMLNIANYKRNSNQNCNEVLPHTGQDSHH